MPDFEPQNLLSMRACASLAPDLCFMKLLIKTWHGISSVLLTLVLIHLYCWCVESYACQSSQSCLNDVISVSENINCLGYESCQSASLTTSGGKVQCLGSFGCYQAQNIVQQSLDGVYCGGLLSCAQVSTSISSQSAILCRGEQSCAGSYLFVSSSSDESQTKCTGSHSCVSANLTSVYDVTLAGACALVNGTIILMSTYQNQHLFVTGSESLAGATIICHNSCTIFCQSATGCNNATFLCYDGSHFDSDTASCEYNFVCNGSMMNEACPNGFELSFSSFSGFELPSFKDTLFSTATKSHETCALSTNSSQPLSCNDYQDEDCYSKFKLTTTFENPGPICCNGMNSCSFTTNISVVFVPQDNIRDMNTCFRSDGSSAANGGTGLRKNCVLGGDMYFAGWDGTSGVINGNGLYDVFATGDIGYLINNVKNVYCMCSSCGGSKTFSNIWGNLYAYSESSVRASVISNIYGDIYCDGSKACAQVEATDIRGNIIAASFQVTYQATIANVGGTLLSYGYEALAESEVTNITSVIVNGDECLSGATVRQLAYLEVNGGNNSLDGAVIYSESPNGTFQASLSGDNNGVSQIFCNRSDICTIDCKSSKGCYLVQLYCFGVCFIKCDIDLGISCPINNDSFNLSSNWIFLDPTSMPMVTLMPSNMPSMNPITEEVANAAVAPFVPQIVSTTAFIQVSNSQTAMNCNQNITHLSGWDSDLSEREMFIIFLLGVPLLFSSIMFCVMYQEVKGLRQPGASQVEPPPKFCQVDSIPLPGAQNRNRSNAMVFDQQELIDNIPDKNSKFINNYPYPNVTHEAESDEELYVNVVHESPGLTLQQTLTSSSSEAVEVKSPEGLPETGFNESHDTSGDHDNNDDEAETSL